MHPSVIRTGSGMCVDGQPAVMLSDDAMRAASELSPIAHVVASAAGNIGLPRSVVHALGVAAEMVDMSHAGFYPSCPEIDALAQALQPIIARAEAVKATA